MDFLLSYCSDALAYCSVLCTIAFTFYLLYFIFYFLLSPNFNFSKQHSAQTKKFGLLQKRRILLPDQLTFRERKTQLPTFIRIREKMPLQVQESTCCTNCHRLLQRIAVLETKLLTGPSNQTEHTTELRHEHPQHTGESHETSAPRQVEKQADRLTNRWHKQGARPKGTRDIRLSRASHIAAVASSTPDTALTRIANTGLLPPPIHLENRFEVLMNVNEESPNVMNVIEHRLNGPVANTDANWRSRSSRQRHSAQSTAEPRTLIVGDSIIRNISSRDITTCCLPQATTSDVNRELQNILMKHKTANRLIIHVGKNDIHKEQSELLKKDFHELFETLKRLKVQTFISGPLPARGTNRFSRLHGCKKPAILKE